MKFKYKPSEDLKSFNQFINYLLIISPIYQIYFLAMKVVILLMIVVTIIEVLSSYYGMFLVVIGFGIILSIITALVVLAILKLLEKGKLKGIANNTFNDNNSTFYFTIDDDCIVRESDNSRVQIPLTEINSIEMLKDGLILNSDKAATILFIPNHCIPISVKEFIDIFKKNNPSLKINEIIRQEKILVKRRCIVVIVSIVLAILIGYFIGKTNYEGNYVKKNLVMQNQLVYSQVDNTYLYENKEYGIGIYFPEKWDTKYGIEAMQDRINVYYLPDGKEGPKDTLLFSVSKTLTLNDFDNYNFIRTVKYEGANYGFFAPKKVPISNKEKFEEYKSMYSDIKFLYTKEIGR